MKKFLSLVLAMSMLLSMTVVSMAATTVVTTGDELQNAINAAGTGDTIKLGANINYGDITTTQINVENSKTITIDLNGYTISAVDAVASGSFTMIENYGNLTITDTSAAQTGKITMSASNNRGWGGQSTIIGNANISSGSIQVAALNIVGGTIEHTGGSDMAIAINTSNNTGLDELNISGGTIKSTYRTIRLFVQDRADATTLNITGGTIESSSNYAVWVQNTGSHDGAAKIDISGGTLDGGLYLQQDTSTNYDVSVSGGEITKVVVRTTSGTEPLAEFITGGTFIDDVSDYLADGFEQDENGVVGDNGGSTTLRPVVGTEAVAGTLAAADGPYKYNATAKEMQDVTAAVPFGTTIYYALVDDDYNFVTTAKTVDGLKVSAVWEEGAAYVSGVEIVKKTSAGVDASVGKNMYYLAVNTTGASTENVDVLGDVLFTGRSGTDKAKIKHELEDVAFTLGYATGTVNADAAAVDGKTLTAYNFANLDDDATATSAYEITFGGKFVVTANVRSEKVVVMACDEDVIDEINDAYPEANLDFYACTGSFKKTAKVLVELEEGKEFLYEVVDGQLVEVDGEYDDWAEEFTFKTKKMGTYVISDVELDLAPVVAANPSTGAAA